MLDFEILKEISHSTPILKVLKYYKIEPTSSSFNRYNIICPFHNDHSPSMIVYDNKGNDDSFYCYVCNCGGDPFRFIQLKEENNFKKALFVLSQVSGVEINTDVDELDFILSKGKNRDSFKVKDPYNLQLSVAYRELFKRRPDLERIIESRFKEIDLFIEQDKTLDDFLSFFDKEIAFIKNIERE